MTMMLTWTYTHASNVGRMDGALQHEWFGRTEMVHNPGGPADKRRPGWCRILDTSLSNKINELRAPAGIPTMPPPKTRHFSGMVFDATDLTH
jgi:hypothetical protein